MRYLWATTICYGLVSHEGSQLSTTEFCRSQVVVKESNCKSGLHESPQARPIRNVEMCIHWGQGHVMLLHLWAKPRHKFKILHSLVSASKDIHTYQQKGTFISIGITWQRSSKCITLPTSPPFSNFYNIIPCPKLSMTMLIICYFYEHYYRNGIFHDIFTHGFIRTIVIIYHH